MYQLSYVYMYYTYESSIHGKETRTFITAIAKKCCLLI